MRIRIGTEEGLSLVKVCCLRLRLLIGLTMRTWVWLQGWVRTRIRRSTLLIFSHPHPLHILISSPPLIVPLVLLPI